MKIFTGLLFAFFVSVPAVAQPLAAASIIDSAEHETEEHAQTAVNINGTMKTSVEFSSSILGRHAAASGVYSITISGGNYVASRVLALTDESDSAFTRMMARESRHRLNRPAFRTAESAFPWMRYLERGNRKREFTAELISDSSEVAGKRCYEIRFELDAEGDSLSAEGDGRIWIDTATFLPVRTYHDFSVSGRRGRAEVRTYSDFAQCVGGVPVLLRSEIQTMPKFLFFKVGTIRIVVEQSDFNLE